MAKHERILPSQSGRRYFCFCSGVPQCRSVCMLPSSGAWQLRAKGPKRVLPASAETAAIARWPRPMPPYSAGMWGSQRPCSRAALRILITPRTRVSRSSSRSAISASVGRTTSLQKRRTRSIRKRTSSGNVKSMAMAPPSVRECRRSAGRRGAARRQGGGRGSRRPGDGPSALTPSARRRAHPSWARGKEHGMRRSGLFGILCGVALLAGSASAAPTTLRMAVTDIAGLELLQSQYGTFRDTLSKALGQDVEFYPVSNRTAAVEAMRAQRVDFVLTGPAEYVVFRKLAGARPVVAFSRPDYYSTIVTLADSGIRNLQDLKGRKVAFGAIGSTSDHLAAAQLLADAGLDPQRDVIATHVDRNIAWEALKRRDVAAVALGYRKLTIVRENEKDLPPGAFRGV